MAQVPNRAGSGRSGVVAPSPLPRGGTGYDEIRGLLIAIALCGVHAFLIWRTLGGWLDLTSNWPVVVGDHGLHYSHAVSTRDFLWQSGFSAGYDPSFMAGFPMSVISGTSSTLSNLVVMIFGGTNPAAAYKFFILVSLCLLPVLVGWATMLFDSSPRGAGWSVGLYVIYFWSDFPKNYAGYGMISYVLAIPLGLVALASLGRYLERGGGWRWTGAAVACSVVFLVHVTTVLVVGPAGLVAYAVALSRKVRGRALFPAARQVGFWTLPVVILVTNAFWWLPGFWLRSTVGVTEFMFAHPESVALRLGRIFWDEPQIESVLIGLGVLGVATLVPVRPVLASGLVGIIAAGLGWGYLAGAFRQFDGLQPGRQTYAFYAGLCVASGVALSELLAWVRSARPGHLDRWLAVGLVGVGIRLFGPPIFDELRASVFGQIPFLSSRPMPSMVRLVDQIRLHIKPGERLLYEESGIGIDGVEDRFYGRHFSPILPSMTGVEVLGGPYLHTPVTSNFTQFGEGKLFGVKNWDRDQFVRYAQLYRPSAIVCWTPQARKFCEQNPDLIQILSDQDGLILGRVAGFGGFAIRGQARVDASPNRLVVRDAVADSDGLLILRYHATPCLIADPSTPIEPVYLLKDPVPFIGLRPHGPGPITIRMAFPPATGWLGSPWPAAGR